MPEQYVGSNKTIAKNTIMLYLRMFLTMIVGLYTSRVVLSTLGVENYGVYNAVGGIVGMLSFLNATMSGATSRFIAFELGRGDEESLFKTFNSALLVHICIAILVFLLLETGGGWYLKHKLIIPQGREVAAQFVFQASIVSMIFGVVNVPFNACIIAHEKMEVYAYIEIYRAFAKLGIVFLLPIFPYDSLKFYAFLTALISISIILINNVYCRLHFEECRKLRRADKGVVKSILSFSIFNLFGNFGAVFNRQGIVILINNFFGVVANAASGLATTVANMVSTFANTMITAFRPPITKSYATGNTADVEKFSLMAFILAIYLFCLVAIPAGIEMEKLIDLWQKIVPENTVVFSRIILMCIIFEIIRHIATITIHATGKVKVISLCNGIVLTLNPFIIYLIYKQSAPVYTAYLSYMGASFLLACISIILMVRYVPELSFKKISWSIAKSFTLGLVSLLLTFIAVRSIPSSAWRILVTTIVSSVIVTSLFYVFSLNRDQRSLVVQYIQKKLKR